MTTTASIVESIKFTRRPGSCEFGNRHDGYTIAWTRPDGTRVSHATYWCPHPLCGMSSTRWRMSTSRPEVQLTEWIPSVPNAVAVAYLLVIYPPGALPYMEARIGICDQWEDRRAGNIGDPDERRLFTQRYFAESGPGVYSAPICDISAGGTEETP